MIQTNAPFFAVNEPYEIYYKLDMPTVPVGAHTHNVAEIYLTLTELPDVLLNDTVSKVYMGSLIIIPPFCAHQLYHENGVAYERYILNIDTEWLDHVLCEEHASTGYLKNADRPLIISLTDNQLTELTGKMKKLIAAKSENEIVAISRFFDLYNILNTFVSKRNENNMYTAPIVVGGQKKVNEIIAYINLNLMTEISVEQISEHFFMNKDYISRLFSRHTHTSIGKYIALKRISKAQELLRAGKTVIEVQEMMGYSSYAHFFKTFQKLTGISPSKYRKQYTKQ